MNSQIDSLYRYFGGKIAIYYAFYSYLTCSSLFISILSLVSVFYYSDKIISSLAIFPSFGLTYCLWATIMIEMWKRKSAEIVHKWGLSMEIGSGARRKEYLGDEYHKSMDEPLDKHYKGKSTYISFLVGVPIIFGLMYLIVVVFQLTRFVEKEYSDSISQSTLLSYIPNLMKSLFIYLLNTVYNYIAVYFVKLENHKFEDKMENSLILKLFTFRLINSMTAIIFTGFIDGTLAELKALLYSFVLVRILSELSMRWLIPSLYYLKAQKVTFMRTDKIKKRNETIKRRIDNIESSLRSIADLTNATRRRISDKTMQLKGGVSFDEIDELENVQEDTSSKVKQLVAFIGKPKKVNFDFIEITSQMSELNDYVFFYADFVQVYVFISLFASVIPLGAVLFTFSNLLCIHFNLHSDLFRLRRSRSVKATSIGFWLDLFEIVNAFSIALNCFIFYYFNDNMFNQYSYILDKFEANELFNEYGIGSGEFSLFLIVVIEHVLLAVLYLIKLSVPDRPSWVDKEIRLLTSEVDKLNRTREQKFREDLTREIRMKTDRFRLELEEKERQIATLSGKVENYENKISQFAAEQEGKTEAEYYETVIEKLQDQVSKLRTVRKGERGVEIDKLIDRRFDTILKHHIKSIMIGKNNILKEEKQSLYDAIHKIYTVNAFLRSLQGLETDLIYEQNRVLSQNIQNVILLCDCCYDYHSEFECFECNEHFCRDCIKTHHQNPLWSEHNVVDTRTRGKPESFFKPTNDNASRKSRRGSDFSLANALKKNRKKQRMSVEVVNGINWIKMTKFAFPTSIQSVNYENMKIYFELLKDHFLRDNGILEANVIDVKEFVLHLLEFQNQLISNPFSLTISALNAKLKDLRFKLEEMFLLNRVFYWWVKRMGDSIEFSQFYSKMKEFQVGVFEVKLPILLQLLDVYDTGVIYSWEVIKYLGVSGLQDSTLSYRVEDIVFDLFGKTDFIKFDECLSRIKENSQLNNVFRSVLQV